MKSTDKPYFELNDKLYIEEEIRFSEDMVREFCEITKDTNKIHPPIVPGMQILTRALANIHSIGYADLFSQRRLINAYFGDILKVNENASIGFVPESNSDELEIYAKKKNKNILTINENNSTTHNHGNSLDFFLTDEGINRSIEVNEDQLKTYAKIIGLAPENSSDAPRTPASDFLFTIAHSSHALINCVNDPRSELEQKINGLMNKNNPAYPVYTSLAVMRNEKAPKEILPGKLTFLTQFIQLDKRKYEVRIHCSQNRNAIYSAIYGITMIPEKILDEMLRKN